LTLLGLALAVVVFTGTIKATRCFFFNWALSVSLFSRAASWGSALWRLASSSQYRDAAQTNLSLEFQATAGGHVLGHVFGVTLGAWNQQVRAGQDAHARRDFVDRTKGDLV
jgi:hypothetical protein